MNWEKYHQAIKQKDFNALFDIAEQRSEVAINKILDDAEKGGYTFKEKVAALTTFGHDAELASKERKLSVDFDNDGIGYYKLYNRETKEAALELLEYHSNPEKFDGQHRMENLSSMAKDLHRSYCSNFLEPANHTSQAIVKALGESLEHAGKKAEQTKIFKAQSKMTKNQGLSF